MQSAPRVVVIPQRGSFRDFAGQAREFARQAEQLGGVPSSPDEYHALVLRRTELQGQLNQAQERRGELANQLRRFSTEAKVLGITQDAEGSAALKSQLAAQDQRIARLQQEVDQANDQIAATPADVLNALQREHTAIAVMPSAEGIGDRLAHEIVPITGIVSLFFLLPIALGVARLLWKRASAPAARPALSDAQAATQLAQLQQSVDAIALEVERISEGQRYAAKLLSEKERPAIRA